jgi:hypothetical protein
MGLLYHYMSIGMCNFFSNTVSLNVLLFISVQLKVQIIVVRREFVVCVAFLTLRERIFWYVVRT